MFICSITGKRRSYTGISATFAECYKCQVGPSMFPRRMCGDHKIPKYIRLKILQNFRKCFNKPKGYMMDDWYDYLDEVSRKPVKRRN
jgi:hypothetical protein